MHDVIKAVQKEIKKVDKPTNHMNYQRGFKERLKNPVGLKTPVRRKVYTKVFKEIVYSYTKDEILSICDEMVESGIQYMGSCAFDWAKKLHRQLDKSDFIRFEKWPETERKEAMEKD